MFSCYGKLSTEVYDLDKPVGRSFGEIEFYSSRLTKVEGLILEPAIGSGRVLIPLLKEGFKIEGFDISAEMLESCQQRLLTAGLQSRLWLANMSDFESEHSYEAIIIPTGSFLLIDSREESLRALGRFYEKLHRGGRLLVDVFLQTEFDIGRVKTKTWKTAESNIITMESKLVDVDFYTQQSVTYLKYEKWNQGRLVDTELQKFALRWFGIEEFRAILEKIGFRDIQIFVDYKHETSAATDSSVFTFEAFKH